MNWKYLKQVNEIGWVLDHRLTPEVRAMMCAMASRMPAGGIQQRYRDVVTAVGLEGEERLCGYPLHPRVREFFDKFVLRYGHGSIKELTGSPSVFFEGISMHTSYLSFDNPLVAGQEFSTRALRRKNWPMCFEACGLPELQSLHDDWLAVFDAEVETWKEYFNVPAHRARHGVEDKEPFRPALDRARWALPSTIATGVSHTSNVRAMGRVIADGKAFTNNSKTWALIQHTYEKALPGLKGMWLREAVAGDGSPLPGHLRIEGVQGPPSVRVNVQLSERVESLEAYRRQPKAYLDPQWNQLGRVEIEFPCSWMVARDWHRHRCVYPWRARFVETPAGEFQLHDTYTPVSKLALEFVGEGGNRVRRFIHLMDRSRDLYERFRREGDMEKAMLCIPGGTLMSMRASGGLRDVTYMLELRANAHGANFEYKSQALLALTLLKQQLGEKLCRELLL